mmetsp:Transcript_44962/g.71837  ORF Transcript_44962/g.71837 Transcript_44962/m.71837 type:complete len:205 (+) Transcript_44962:1154-1768(+)
MRILFPLGLSPVHYVWVVQLIKIAVENFQQKSSSSEKSSDSPRENLGGAKFFSSSSFSLSSQLWIVDFFDSFKPRFRVLRKESDSFSSSSLELSRIAFNLLFCCCPACWSSFSSSSSDSPPSENLGGAKFASSLSSSSSEFFLGFFEIGLASSSLSESNENFGRAKFSDVYSYSSLSSSPTPAFRSELLMGFVFDFVFVAATET